MYSGDLSTLVDDTDFDAARTERWNVRYVEFKFHDRDGERDETAFKRFIEVTADWTSSAFRETDEPLAKRRCSRNKLLWNVFGTVIIVHDRMRTLMNTLSMYGDACKAPLPVESPDKD